MKHIKRSIYLSVLMTMLLTACQYNDEADVVTGDQFVAGKIVSLMVAEDYEVTFWEQSPGNLMLIQDRTVDADMSLTTDLRETLKMNDYVEMYKKLAGNNADKETIRKLAAAQTRRENPLLRELTGRSEEGIITSSLDERTNQEGARAQASCQEQKNGRKYFVDNYVTGNSDVWATRLGTPPYSEYIGPMPSHQAFNLIILNGQKSGSGNTITVQVPGLFFANIRAWHIVTAGAYIGPNEGGLFSVHFPNGLNCATTYIAFELINF